EQPLPRGPRPVTRGDPREHRRRLLGVDEDCRAPAPPGVARIRRIDANRTAPGRRDDGRRLLFESRVLDGDDYVLRAGGPGRLRGHAPNHVRAARGRRAGEAGGQPGLWMDPALWKTSGRRASASPYGRATRCRPRSTSWRPPEAQTRNPRKTSTTSRRKLNWRAISRRLAWLPSST